MNSMATGSESVSTSRIKGAFYTLQAWAWRYPSEESLATLCSLADALTSTTATEVLHPRVVESLTSARARLAERSDILLHLQTRYSELFGHTVRGACPLYELEYGNAEIVQQAGELADITGFYQAFGLMNAESGERADHVSVQSEFLSVLCFKHAHGLQSQQTELQDACADAYRTFLRDHLAGWLPALATRVNEADDEDVYGCLARAAISFIESECAELGVTAGPTYLELRDADPQADVEINCGAPASRQLVPLTVGETEGDQ